MAEFIDKLMVKYLTPASVDALLVPGVDTKPPRALKLLSAVYDMQYLEVREVDRTQVIDKEFQVPISQPVDVRGTIEKLIPQSERTLTTFTINRRSPDCWAEMRLTVRVSVKVAVTQAALERVATTDLSDVNSLADFQSRFDFLNLDDFMAQSGIKSLQQLKESFPRLFRLQFAQPSTDATVRDFLLTVYALFFPALDLAAALQRAKSCRAASEAARPHLGSFDGGEIRMGSAWMVIFPAAAVTATSPTQSDTIALFEPDFVAAFETV